MLADIFGQKFHLVHLQMLQNNVPGLHGRFWKEAAQEEASEALHSEAFCFTVKMSADIVISQIFDIFLHKFSLFQSIWVYSLLIIA